MTRVSARSSFRLCLQEFRSSISRPDELPGLVVKEIFGSDNLHLPDTHLELDESRKVAWGEACTKLIGTGYPRRTEAKFTRRTKEKFWPINAGNSNASKKMAW